MKNMQEYIKKDIFCKGLILVLIVTIGYGILDRNALNLMQPISNFAFLILVLRFLLDTKLEKTSQVKTIIWVLIIGYGLNSIWNSTNLFR